MAIAFDAATGDKNNGGTGTLNFNHTFGSLSDAYAVVAIMRLFDNNLTAVTVDGNSATDLLGGPVALQTGAHFGFLYGVPLGSISGSKAVAISAATNQYILAGIASYSGVAQASTLDGTDSEEQLSANTLTGTITTTVDNAWTVIAGFRPFDGDAVAVDTSGGAAQRTRDNTFFEWALGDSNGAVSPAGSTSLSVTGPTNKLGFLMAAIKPAGGGGGFDPTSITGSLVQPIAFGRRRPHGVSYLAPLLFLDEIRRYGKAA